MWNARTGTYVGLALLLAAVSSVLPRVFGMDLARPLLLVPFVFHLASVAETSEGAVLSCAGGFFLDAAGALPTGLFASALVAAFVVARVVLLGVAVGGFVFEVLVTALLVVVFHGATWGLAQVNGGSYIAATDTPWAAGTLWSIAGTLAGALPVAYLCRRIERAFPRQDTRLA